MSDASRDFLRRRYDAIAQHPSRIGVGAVTVLAEGEARYRLRLELVPDAGGSGKHARLDDLTSADLAFTTPDPQDPTREVPVDGLFAVEDVERDGDRLDVLVCFGGDEDLGRRFEESVFFTLRLAGVPDVDPFFAEVRFSLAPEEPLPLDCGEEPPASAEAPPLAIDYRVRDYAGFRQRMLAQLGRRLPEWSDRSAADPLVTLVELLADAADRLSYQQDAAATEAYLGTARKRISVRRHARLVGYPMGEGHNARVLVHFEVSGDVTLSPGLGTLTSLGTTVTGSGTAFTAELLAGLPIAAGGETRTVLSIPSDTELEVDRPFDPPLAGAAWSRAGTPLLTRVERLQGALVAPGTTAEREAFAAAPKVFETVHPATLYSAHNAMAVYTWGAPVFSLPAGSERATLVGRFPNLSPGDVVIFEAVKDAATGLAAAADFALRHAVRLVAVRGDEDPLGDAAVLGSPAAGTGTLTSAAGAVLVEGTGTAFTSELRPGDLIVAGGQPRRVAAIASDTELDVEHPFDASLASAAFTLGRLTEIVWHEEEALPFLLPVSRPVDDGAGNATVVSDLAVARGNVVLADHGRTVGRPRRFAAGTVTTIAGADTVTGTGTDFVNQLAVGATVHAAGQTRQVTAVASATALTVDAPFEPPLSAATRLALEPPGEELLAAVHRYLTGSVTSSGTAVTGTGTEFRAELHVGARVRTAGQVRRVTAVSSATGLTVHSPFDPELPAGTRLTYAGFEPRFVRAGRFRPRLSLGELTHRRPYDHDAVLSLPASRLFADDGSAAGPVVDLRDREGVWTRREDLLTSDRFARDFVVETDAAGVAVLRFGDGDLGRPPDDGTEMFATFRVGQGPEGNLGRDALVHVITDQTGIVSLRNPLPASGGRAPEPIDEARRKAPGRLLGETLDAGFEQRFTRLLESHPLLERAAARLRWNGSWHVLRLAVRRRDGAPLDDAFREELARFLEDDRPAAWELDLGGLEFVPLDLAFTVLLSRDAVRRRVENELLSTFSSRRLADGRLGFFHRDNFTFGESVFLSRLLDVMLAVRGVEAVDLGPATRFRRFGDPARDELELGQIRLSGLELPRVDNDPANPGNGRIRFFLEGGR